MKSPIGKHGNITQTVPNDTSARARRARSSYKFKNVTSPWREWRYPMKKPYEQKIFLAARIGGGEEEVPTECGEIPMVSELEGGENDRPT